MEDVSEHAVGGGACSNSNGGGGDRPGPSKRAKTVPVCIIHCSNEEIGTNLTSPKDFESWKTLLKAAEIRQYAPILEISKTLQENTVPEISYHRKCRSVFTMKRDLEKICDKQKDDEVNNPTCQRVLHRRSSSHSESSSRIYEPVCIFCETKSKYQKKSKSREALTQCVELRCDEAVRKAATEKQDSRMLAIVSRDLVAAEGQYHRSCYREYTRLLSTSYKPQTTADTGCTKVEDDAYERLFSFIREDVFVRPRVIKLTDLTSMLLNWITESGKKQIRDSTKKHIRRKLALEFGETLHFILNENGKLLVFPDNLSLADVIKVNAQLTDKIEQLESNNSDSDSILRRAALDLRNAIQDEEVTSVWPPLPSDLNSGTSYIPDTLRCFLQYLLGGQREASSLSPRIQRLIDSVGQDLVYGVTRAKQIPPKHILLPYAVKTLTGNVELVQMINRLGYGVSYSKVEEIDTALCLQKLACETEGTVTLPELIQPYIQTTLGWDNIDRLEETQSGGNTSHRVNGIALQQAVYGPQLPKRDVSVPKEKQRTVETGHVFLPTYNAGLRTGPPPRPYTQIEADNIKREASKKNLIWLLARLHSCEDQSVSSWTGFNISVRDKVEVMKDVVGYLPTINAPATEMATVHEILVQSQKIRNTLHLNSIVVVFDQAIYAKATEILWKHADKFGNIIPRLGAFHTICTHLGIIGKRFQDAGLKDLCIESFVVAEGSVHGVLDGRKYNRAVRFHKLLYEALMRLAWREFPNWLDVHDTDGNCQIDSIKADISVMVQDLCQETFTNVLEHSTFLFIADQFDKYLDFLRHGNGELASFWMSYVDMVRIMLNLLRASREGNWQLHLSAIHEMIPWCFSYDKINYARYLSAYYAEMSNLPTEHPDIHAYLEAGGFSVQIGSSNPFGKIAVDQTVEETVNKDTQTPGGTKGFSLKAGALNRYYHTAEYRSSYLRLLKNMLDMNHTDSHHKDLQKTRIIKDENDVTSLIDMLDSTWINPFDADQQDLVSISTGRVASADVASDLLNAYTAGEKAYKTFREERLQSNPPVKSFHDPLPKQKLKTFSTLLQKEKSCKESSKGHILKADRNLFARMILIAQSRNLEMKEVLSHPLGPIPWALATHDGSLRKTNKAALAKHIQKCASPAENIPEQAACLIDGMALVHKIKGFHKTFAEVAQILLSLVLTEAFKSKRVDVIFDVYKTNSIKNAERGKRGASDGTQFKNIAPGHSIQQWKKFLASSQNKESFIKVVVDEWRQPKYNTKFSGKEVYVTCHEKCYKLSAIGPEVVDELRSTQEEADTRILLHAAHAASAGYHSVKVVSDDTDVFALCVAFSPDIPCHIYQKSGTQARTKYIDIQKIASILGRTMCKALLGLHAITGCDSVSSFAGRGKVAALKLLKTHPEYKEALQELGCQWNLNNDLQERLEAFTCHVYNAKASINSVNELRYRLFCAKSGESWQLPPCAAALKKHCERANYQAGVWKRCLESCPDIPSPVGKGWCMEVEDGEDQLVIDWIDVPPAPEAVLQLLSCKCSRSCKAPTCPCCVNGLRCTDVCKLQTCTNQVIEDASDDECEEENDNSDEDEWN